MKRRGEGLRAVWQKSNLEELESLEIFLPDWIAETVLALFRAKRVFLRLSDLGNGCGFVG